MSKHGPIRAERPTPSRAKLIALLIEERAKVLALCNIYDQGRKSNISPSDRSRDQARREIEAEVLTKAKP